MNTQPLQHPEQALELETEELAVLVLQRLADIREHDPDSIMLHRANFINNLYQESPNVEVSRAFAEAWAWLERELLLVHQPGNLGEMVFITRRGDALLKTGNVEVYARSNVLREMTLNPQLARKVYPTYLRGDYDTAVFQAFKEVEVRVRQAGGFGNDKIGTNLMRAAFHADDGPLTDGNQEAGERQSLSDLFAGAIGVMKNPGSHRDTELDDPQEAAEAILFANHLLRIVDRATEQSNNAILPSAK